MAFLSFLNRLLDLANFSQEKRQRFIDIFYQYYYTRLIDGIGGLDPTYGQKLMSALDHAKENPEALGELWAELNSKEMFKAKIDEITDEVVAYLMNDVMKSANEEEKAQILQSISPS